MHLSSGKRVHNLYRHIASQHRRITETPSAQLAMMSSPTEVVQRLHANALDADVVRDLVSPTTTYVPLCYSNPDLKKLMPYAGLWDSKGPDAIIYTFKTVNSIWKNKSFDIETIFGNGENVAVFGRFTYRSAVLGKPIQAHSLYTPRCRTARSHTCCSWKIRLELGPHSPKMEKRLMRFEDGKKFDIELSKA